MSDLHVTLTLTLEWPIWHTVVHHSSTSTYTSNFTRIGQTVNRRMDRHTAGQTLSLALLGWLRGVNPKNGENCLFTVKIYQSIRDSKFWFVCVLNVCPWHTDTLESCTTLDKKRNASIKCDTCTNIKNAISKMMSAVVSKTSKLRINRSKRKMCYFIILNQN